MKIALLTTQVFHDAAEIKRSYDGKIVQGKDKVIYGGAERVLVDLCRLFQKDGHEITVFQPFYGIPKMFTKNFKGIPVVCLPINGGWEYQTNIDLNWQFNEHAAMYDLRIYFAPFLAWPNVVSPCITVSHGIYWDNIEGASITRALNNEQYKEFFERNLYGFLASDAVVSVDSNTRRVVQAMKPGYEKRIHIIYNYVDCQNFYPAEKKDWEGINILFPRRLTTMRGSTEITKAFVNMPHLNFTLAGQSWDEAAGKTFADSHRHRENVSFIHREMDDMPPVYRKADISLVPTKSSEGLSLSVLESMASGLPIITTPVGGIGDAIIDGYNALVYDPNHDNVCDYIQALADDEGTRLKFGKRNREIACECFDIEIWKARWRHLLAQFGVVPVNQYQINKPVEELTDEEIEALANEQASQAIEEQKQELLKIRQHAIDSKPKKQKLVAMMLTHNESGRYLERVIENTLLFCDEIVILDDHSTDYKKLREIADKMNPIGLGKATRIFIRESDNSWENESILRQELLSLACELHPDWLIAIDADEFYEADRMSQILPYLLNQDKADWIGFRFFDMWDDEEHYRDDDNWPAGNFYAPRMFRVDKNTVYSWPDKKRHCGSLPQEVMSRPGMKCEVRVKHFGWMKPEDRDRKYKERIAEDPDSKFLARERYEAVNDPSPTLVKWDDNNPWQTGKLTIAYPPGMHWDIMQQRPHHILKLAANERYRVFFGDDSAPGTYEALPYLTLVNDWDNCSFVKKVDIAYVNASYQLKYLKDMKYKTLIYDNVDFFDNSDFEFLKKANYILCASRMLFDRAVNILKSSGKSLIECKYSYDEMGALVSEITYEDFSESHIMYLPNACDFEHFSKTGEPDPKVGNVIAYVGVVYEGLNQKVLHALAEKYKIVLIGEQKCYIEPHPNIYTAGHIHYNKLPGILSQAKVAIRPIDINSDYTLYQGPVKIYEYLAAGRPVVASPIPELKPLAEQELIRLVPTDDVEGWVKAVDEAMKEYPNNKGKDWAKEQTWAHRWQAMKKFLELK